MHAANHENLGKRPPHAHAQLGRTLHRSGMKCTKAQIALEVIFKRIRRGVGLKPLLHILIRHRKLLVEPRIVAEGHQPIDILRARTESRLIEEARRLGARRRRVGDWRQAGEGRLHHWAVGVAALACVGPDRGGAIECQCCTIITADGRRRRTAIHRVADLCAGGGGAQRYRLGRGEARRCR